MEKFPHRKPQRNSHTVLLRHRIVILGMAATHAGVMHAGEMAVTPVTVASLKSWKS